MQANPIVRLEVARRFRSPMGAWGIPLLVLLPGLAVAIIYATTLTWSSDVWWAAQELDPLLMEQAAPVSQLQGIGTGMFVAVLSMLVLTLMIMVPGLVGGSIAGERAAQTLQPLQLTALTPGQIIMGKLVASLGYLLVVLVCVAPVLAIPFLLGGLPVGLVLASLVILLLVVIELAAVSLAASALMARAAPAIVVALLVCAAIVVVPWVVMSFLAVLAGTNNPNFNFENSTIRYVATLSPVTLGSWAAGFGGEEFDSFVTTWDRVFSTLWFVVITASSLLFARTRVVAPVERDR